MTSPCAAFDNAPVGFIDTPQARIAYRDIGRGTPLVFVHGFPFHGFTFRGLVDELQPGYRCILPDLPGLGRSTLIGTPQVAVRAQAQTLQQALGKLGLTSYALVAFDSGASIARHLAALDSSRVSAVVLLNTEVPGQRPPYLPTFSKLLQLPGSMSLMRALLSWRRFAYSPLMLGACYYDASRLDEVFWTQYVAPILTDTHRFQMMGRMLRDFDWAGIDALAAVHRQITAPVGLIWGADCTIFPEPQGRAMANQFPRLLGFHSVAKAKLLVHEEHPAEVAARIREYLAQALERAA